MSSSAEEMTIEEGSTIFGSNGEKVGKVVAVQDDHLVVEKGFLFPSDYYIPGSAVTSVDGKNVYLNVSKEQALDQGWDTAPVATTTTDTYDADRMDRTVEDNQTWPAAAGETITVPVQEEQLSATRREVARGAVRVEKDVVEEERKLDVPVTEEQVTVNRRTVDRAATTDDMSFQGGSFEVPIRGEEVEVQKRARVTEEIEIGKEAVERTERVTDTVRREEVRIDDQSTGGISSGSRSDRQRGR